jgi:FkbM family methyltransferase
MNRRLKRVLRGILAPVAPAMVSIARWYIQSVPIKSGKIFCIRGIFFLGVPFRARTIAGSMIEGNTADKIQAYLFCFGLWEPNLTQIVTSRLKGERDRTFIDVGANIGYFTLLAAQCMPRGRVVAVEPFPTIFQKLRRNIELNGYQNIRTLNIAATSEGGLMEMYHAGPGNEGATTLIPGVFNTAPTMVQGAQLSMALTKEEIESVRLIKIDTEGTEHAVIKDLLSLLPRFPEDVEFVVEITPEVAPKEHVAEIFAWFHAAGYHPYGIPNPYADEYYLFSQQLHRISKLSALPESQTDVIFSRAPVWSE